MIVVAMVALDYAPRVQGVLCIEQEEWRQQWSVQVAAVRPDLVGKRVRVSARGTDGALHVGVAMCTMASALNADGKGYTQLVGSGPLVKA